MSLQVLNSPLSRFNKVLMTQYRVMYKKATMSRYEPLYSKGLRAGIQRDLADGDAMLVGEHKKTKTLYVFYR